MQPIPLYYPRPRAIFILVFYSLFLALLVLCLTVPATTTSRTLPVVLGIFVLVLLAPAAHTAINTLSGKPMYTISDQGITYFRSPGLIPWHLITAIEVLSPLQTNDKTWKLYIKMASDSCNQYNWWIRFHIKNNRRISHGNADFIIIVSYLTLPPQQTIDTILSAYRQYRQQ